MSGPKPTVDHHFNGESRLLSATLNRRAEIRNALAALLTELSQLERQPVQVEADIRFNILGPVPKSHVYTVSVTDPNFDAALFARTKTPAGRAASATSPVPSRADGRPASSSSDARSLKRPRTDGDDLPARTSRGSIAADANLNHRVEEILSFIKTWHGEWTRQGGWLFDTLSAMKAVQKENKDACQKKLETVQDVLGHSINSSTASTMAELNNITKLIPWLDDCRKANADKMQAREEQWRSSSATFHDQSRRDREAAEKRLEDRLQAQTQLLIRVAEANGIDVDEDDKRSDNSLGAQLTAELNLEARRAASNGQKNSNQDTISIDD